MADIDDIIYDPEEPAPGKVEAEPNYALETMDNFSPGSEDAQKVIDLIEQWEFYANSRRSLGKHTADPEFAISKNATIQGDDHSLIWYAYKHALGVELGSVESSLRSLISLDSLDVIGVSPALYGRIRAGDILLFATNGYPDSTGGVATEYGCYMFMPAGITEVSVAGYGLESKITHILRLKEGTA